MKKIWITGSRGFIGKELVSVFEDDNEIKCFTHNTKKNIFKNDQIIQMDFSNEDNITKVVNKFGMPDIFIHLGWASMTNSESKEHLIYNVESSKNLIKKFFDLGLKKFIFLGSRDEYGERNGCLVETMDSIGKISKYAKSKKIVAEYGFEQSKKTGKIFIHIKLFNVYGAGQQKNSLINILYKNFQTKQITHLGPCTHFREYIHISEVCKGIKLISKINKSVSINLGSGKAIRLKDFVNLFWRELGGKKNMIVFQTEQIKKNDPVYPKSYANLKKLNNLTNWTPSLSIEDGIKKTIKKMNCLTNYEINKKESV